ncbi:ATP synthase subunit I [Clostridium botulinum]|uniref:ATP synthase subunit I n=2 Tax=Clostridium botulinum TaxID=1491 RepID=A0A846HXM9_CLOBO|nr:ATP synthase subunit I [Clostridium botulinum]AJD25724.1 ATP synthase I chain family protein [Clostridium botulinum CDC_297]ACQ51903.1 ATP synthase F0, I subunit [Clostridium botulinum Ba4 str. 657]AJE11388.1 ATP synthase I chain family protein [Clostridium botulinum CDC_1436]APR01490.1 ATP synthase I chain family protein [Clostridium botulinum]APU59043.1 ATP synthase I chain family protein [Clostridium botulinum]
MIKEIKEMISRITIFNFLIGITFFIIIYLTFNISYSFCFLIGLILANINLFINAKTTNMIIIKNKNSILSILGFFVRIIIVCALGLLLSKDNTKNIIPFLLGYSSNFISIIFYGTNLGKNKV